MYINQMFDKNIIKAMMMLLLSINTETQGTH